MAWVRPRETDRPSPEPPQVRDDPGWTTPIVLYLVVLAVLLVVSWQTITHVDINPLGDPRIPFGGDWFWGGWMRFDGGWYAGIADIGYSYVPETQSSVAFFPGYPLAVRAVGRLIDNIPLGGILVTIACGLGSMCLFWRWSAARLDRRAATIALATLALYPYAYYLYGAVYGDALFLVAVLGAFLLLERDQPVLAGLVGIVATATRFVGLALVIGLVVGVLERRGALQRQDRWGLPRRLEMRRLRPSDAGVLLSLAGIVGWVAWLWSRYDDPFVFSSVQEEWGQPATPRTWFKLDFVSQVLRGDDRIYAYGLLVQAALAVAVLVLVPFIARRFGLRYGAYTALLVLIPAVGSQDFQGLGRYMIAAFPAFALLGEHLARRPGWARVALVVSACLLALGTAWFAHGLYLA